MAEGIPPHRARVIAVLAEAGFRNNDDYMLPTKTSGGTFTAIGGHAVTVTVDWWGVNDQDRAGLLARVAAALRDAGLEVIDGGSSLHVPHVESR